jgi:transcriptional regulator with XRE-family HTH domain
MPPGAATVKTPALRYWRVQRMLLQEELAKRAQVAVDSVRRGERGEPLRLTTVRALATALKVPPTDLLAQPPADQ